MLERMRERRKKSPQVVECVELVNTKVLGAESLGPIAAHVQIRVPKPGSESEFMDVREIHSARYRFRNLSDTPVSKLFISPKREPPPFWFGITEEGQSSPDWEALFSRGPIVLHKRAANSERRPVILLPQKHLYY